MQTKHINEYQEARKPVSGQPIIVEIPPPQDIYLRHIAEALNVRGVVTSHLGHNFQRGMLNDQAIDTLANLTIRDLHAIFDSWANNNSDYKNKDQKISILDLITEVIVNTLSAVSECVEIEVSSTTSLVIDGTIVKCHRKPGAKIP